MFRDACQQIVLLATAFIALTNGSAFLELYFLEEPHSIAVARGSPALLNCKVHSNLPVDTHWLKDGSVVQQDNRRYQLDNGSLYIDRVEHTLSHRPDEGIYQCRASVQKHGTIVSRKAQVDLWHLRASGNASQVLSLHLGDMAMLPCHVEGIPSPSISWYKDDRPLNLSGKDYFLHCDGSILEIHGVKLSDFGRFRCKARSNGEEVSLETQLTQEYNRSTYLGAVPHFIMTPGDRSATEGEDVVLHCGANGRDRNGKQPHITWLKDGATVELSLSGGRLYVEGQGSLRIKGLQDNDSGLYTCRATNTEDSRDADALLKVFVPPTFLLRPVNVKVQLNSDVELECDVNAKPPAVIEWLKNGEIVIPSDYFQIVDGKKLRILGVMASDEGMYQCMATNAVGNAQAAAQLIIQHKALKATTPAMFKSGISQSARRGVFSEVVNLTATVVSSSYVILAWKPTHSAKELQDVLGYLISWKEVGSPRERVTNTTALEADVQHLKPSTKYTFSVAAYGSQGVSPNAAVVTTETPAEEIVPGQPLNLEVTVLSSTSARVTWESPLLDPSAEPITHYKLYYGIVGDASGELDVNVIETQYAVTGLLKFYEYSFRVVAYNVNGAGITSARVSCHTFSDVPSSAPQIVTVEAASSMSLLLSWEPPPEGSQNGIITGYKIQYKQRREKNGNMITTDGSRRSFSISGLEKGTEYNVSIQAQTVNGSGPSSPWISARTFVNDLDELSVPGKPTSLQVRPIMNTVIVSWTPPIEQDIMIRGYILGYGIGLPDIYRQVLDARLRHYTIRGLRPSVQYVINLKAFNNAGEGVPIYETVTTREETTPEPLTPLMPPVGLKTIVHSSTAMTLTWTDTTLGRSQRVTDNRFYTVRYNPKFQRKYKLINCTDLTLSVDDLLPDMEYEFSVKLSRGQRQSTWSLSVFNKTREAAPSSAPRDLTVVAVRDSTSVILNWQPPRQPNGQLTGFLVYYSKDPTVRDYDWVMEGVIGERLTTTVRDLLPETTYYFKVQAHNDVGYGPMSPTVIFRTPKFDGSDGGMIEIPDDHLGRGILDRPNSKNNWLMQAPTQNKGTSDGGGSGSGGGFHPSYLWIIIGCLGGTFLAVLLVIITACFFCRRSRTANSENSSAQKGALVSPKMVKSDVNDHRPLPPDLWIHGNIELSELDRGSDIDDALVGRRGTRGHYEKAMLDEDGYQNLSLRPVPQMIPLDSSLIHKELPLTSCELKFPGCSNQPSRHNSLSSRVPLHNTPRVNVADISQTNSTRALKPPSGASSAKVPSNAANQPLISPPPICLTSKLTENFNGSDELTEEMANIEGLMKDLSDITRQQFY